MGFSSGGRFTRSGPRSPLVSVIIPAFNAETFIAQAIDSALSQTYRNLEVIVVDDGSQDRTVDVVRSLAVLDERVRLIEQPNQGVAAARNTAMRAARGEFIAPLDADDVWYPEKIDRQVQCFLESGPEVGLVYAWWVAVDEQDSVLWGSAKWDLEGDVYEPLIVTNFIGNASVPLIRRSCIEELGEYDTELKAQKGQGCEDWDLALRIAERFEFRVAREYLVGYRRVKDSMSWDHAAMGTSYELVVRDIPRMHPEIPRHTFRWSKKHFYHWLASRSYADGNYFAALRWLSKAVFWDPPALFSKSVLSTLAKSLIQAAAYPVIAGLWPDHEDWARFRSRLLGRRRETTTLAAVRQDTNHEPYPRKLRSWQPYDRICLRRWQQISPDQDAVDLSKERTRGAQAPFSEGGDGGYGLWESKVASPPRKHVSKDFAEYQLHSDDAAVQAD